MIKIIKPVVVAVQLLFLVGCSTLGTDFRSQRTSARQVEVVTEESARRLATAIASWDRQKLDDLIQNSEDADPILLCAEGNFEMHEGNYENAARLFQDALLSVEQQRVPSVYRAVPFQVSEGTKKRGTGVSLAEDKEIVRAASQFFYGEISNAEMVRQLVSRPTPIPYPPTHRGTMGLALEIVNEHAGKTDYLVHRFASYPEFNEDSAKVRLAVRKVLAINVVTSALLAGDQDALRFGMGALKSFPKIDNETAFFIGLASFFLRSDEVPKFLSRDVRSLLTN
jgi:hypothetical protein